MVPAMDSLSQEKVVTMCWVYRWDLSCGTDRNCWSQTEPGEERALQWNIREEWVDVRWVEREEVVNTEQQKGHLE